MNDEDTARRCSNINKCFVEVKRPAIVKAYNCSMRGVDKTDFLVALNCTTIRPRKWTLRMIFHFLNMSVAYAWLEYRCDADTQGLASAKQLDLLDFTLKVIEALAKTELRPKNQKRGRTLLCPLQSSKQAR